MDSLADPERLRDRDGVAFREETAVVDPEEFDAARETVDSHAVVGLTNDEGAVLLTYDGSHGWTLAAFPVDPGEDWAAIGRRGIERVTGVDVELERPELVRRVEFHPDGDPDRTFRMYNVVVRASPVTGRPIADDFGGPAAEIQEAGWFEGVPADQSGAPADDIRLFVN